MLFVVLGGIFIIIAVLGLIGVFGRAVQVFFGIGIPIILLVFALSLFAGNNPYVWIGYIIIIIGFFIWTFIPVVLKRP